MPSNDKLQFGMIGLGRMGANMVRRLMKAGHPCVVYDRSADAVAALVKEGATGSSSLAEFVKKLDEAARTSASWCPRPTSTPRSASSSRCSRRATPSSTAATRTTRTTSRARSGSATKGLHYVDMGTSGGVWGLERGYCLMIGGETEVVKRLDPIFSDPRPGPRRHPPHPGPREARGHRRDGLPALRARTAPATS